MKYMIFCPGINGARKYQKDRKQRTGMGKYSFVNRTITEWNKLPEGAIGTSQGKKRIFKTRVREM